MNYDPSIFDGKQTVVEQLEALKGEYKKAVDTLNAGPTVEQLEAKINGSETVVVDIDEAGTALEVHLDADVTNKIDRAILQPVAAVAEDSVAVVTPSRDVNYVPVSGLGGGGGKLYKHFIRFTVGGSDSFTGVLLSTQSAAYTDKTFRTFGGYGQLIAPTTGNLSTVSNVWMGTYLVGGTTEDALTGGTNIDMTVIAFTYSFELTSGYVSGAITTFADTVSEI